jgi:hypothetical protein
MGDTLMLRKHGGKDKYKARVNTRVNTRGGL